jgi:hypothetical protein
MIVWFSLIISMLSSFGFWLMINIIMMQAVLGSILAAVNQVQGLP